MLVLRRRRGLVRNFVVTPEEPLHLQIGCGTRHPAVGGTPSDTDLPIESGSDLEKENGVGQDDLKEMARVPATPERA